MTNLILLSFNTHKNFLYLKDIDKFKKIVYCITLAKMRKYNLIFHDFFKSPSKRHWFQDKDIVGLKLFYLKVWCILFLWKKLRSHVVQCLIFPKCVLVLQWHTSTTSTYLKSPEECFKSIAKRTCLFKTNNNKFDFRITKDS